MQRITVRLEQLYFRRQQTPWRQLFLMAFAAFLGFAYARLSTTACQIIIGAILAWTLFLGPFLSAYLPFSDRIREFWQQRRERRRQLGYVAVDGPFWLGMGLALFGLWDGYSSPSNTENFPFCIGLALIVCAPLFALLAFILRRVFHSTNVA